MLRIAGRRYDRRVMPKQLAATLGSHAVNCSAAPLVLRPASSSAKVAAAAAAAATTSSSSSHHQQPPPSSASARSSSAAHRLFVSNSNRPTRLTRIPTPLPPDEVEAQAKAQGQTDGARRVRLRWSTTRPRKAPTQAQATPEEESSDAAVSSSSSTPAQRAMLRNLLVHQSFFPSSQVVEELAVLRTSLDAGLIWRAGKVFEGIRSGERSRADALRRLLPSPGSGRASSRADEQALKDASRAAATAAAGASPGVRLDKGMYDDMLAAYLFKAAVGENIEAKKEFVRRAMALWNDMVAAAKGDANSIEAAEAAAAAAAASDPSLDASAAAVQLAATVASEPAADARTAAIMMRGVGRLLRTWPAAAGPKPRLLHSIFPALGEINVLLVDVLNMPVWTEQPRWEVQMQLRGATSGSAGEGDQPKQLAPGRAETLDALIAEAREAQESGIVSELTVLANTLHSSPEGPLAGGKFAADLVPNRSAAAPYSDTDALRPAEREDLPPLTPTLTTSPASKYIPEEMAAQLPEGAEEDAAGLPYNLHALQENLSAVAEARQRFADPYARQRWFEGSAFDAARKRLRFSVEQMEKQGLGNVELMGDKQLQRWMWDWYKALEARLKQELETIRLALEAEGQFSDRPGKTAGRSGRPPKNKGASAKTSADASPSAKKQPVARVPDETKELYPLLTSVSVSQLALITVLEIVRLLGSGGISDGMKTTRATVSIGRGVEEEKIAQALKRRDAEVRAASEIGLVGPPAAGSNSEPTITNEQLFSETRRIMEEEDYTSPEARSKMRKLNEQSGMRAFWDKQDRWTQPMRARIGSYLVDELMKVAKVERSATDREGRLWKESHPAFYKSYQYLAGKRLGVIKVNDAVAQRMDRDTVQETLHPRRLPMLVPPRPWISHDQGGYFTESTSAMRFKDSAEQNTYLKAASDNGELDRVLAGLDVLGQTAWRINRKVFDVLSEVWNSGQAIAKIPPAALESPEPVKPDNYDTDMTARSHYNLNLRAWALQKAQNHGLRCDINYKLEIARAFIGERFFQPHNMDFRGRAYPIPPNFNHMGNDMCRGLLKFDVAKPLGERGLRWLHIHLANLYGFDKASFSEREQWAKDHEAQVRESARDPLGGSRWWLNADDPWQCLATCFELVEAWDHPEGPEKFKSSMPVHQDGTCNGLQHYAALGGDLAGAKQVNLAGGDRPSDVYTGVADLVIQALDDAAAKGDEIAKKLQGKVTRKVVKQTVMTTVYGVTFVGAKKQIARQLSDRNDIPMNEIWEVSSYLAKLVLSQIGTLFTGATRIQQWLHHAARLIAKSIPMNRVESAISASNKVSRKSRNADGLYVRSNSTVNKISKEQMTSVIWTTALGLPVVQPYRKSKKRQMSTRMQTVYINDPHINHEVSPKKQASAFPPNFIHSLDATHMILTALECHKAKLTFASVHDSYWTHACDIDTMSDFIRDTFATLHSNDILTKLRDEFLERFGDYRVPVYELKSLANRDLGDSPSDLLEPVNSVLAKTLSGEEAKVPIKLGRKAKSSTALEEDSADAGEDAEKAWEDIEGEAEVESDSPASLAEDEALSASAEASDPEPTTAPANDPKAKKEQLINAKFVPLREILPPLPPKGTFDVNEIRESLYFFS